MKAGPATVAAATSSGLAKLLPLVKAAMVRPLRKCDLPGNSAVISNARLLPLAEPMVA